MKSAFMSLALITAILTFAFALAIGPTLAQGGQGGGLGGGGFGGGGMGGGSMGRVGSDDSAQTTSILSPGDTNDFKIDAQENETIIVSVTSTFFDPVAQVATPTGKVLIENDDRKPGDQNPLLLYHFTKAGSYKILVKAAKPGAGGQFALSLTRFVAKSAKIGPRNAYSTSGMSQWLSFPAEANQTMVISASAPRFDPQMILYAPIGEKLETDIDRNSARRTNRMVFRAEIAGTYYLRVSGNNSSQESYAVGLSTAHIRKTTTSAAVSGTKLDAGGLDLWTFEGKAGDFIRIGLTSNGGAVNSELELVSSKQSLASPGRRGDTSDISSLPDGDKSKSSWTAVLQRTGTYQLKVSQPYNQEITYNLTMGNAAQPLPNSGDVEHTIPIGGSDYWSIDARAGDLLQ